LFYFSTVFFIPSAFSFSSSHPIYCACFHPHFSSILLVLLLLCFLLLLCIQYLLILFLTVSIHTVACSGCEDSVVSRQAATTCGRLYRLSLTGSSTLDRRGSLEVPQRFLLAPLPT
jgi:hypothetical protein